MIFLLFRLLDNGYHSNAKCRAENLLRLSAVLTMDRLCGDIVI